MDSGHEVAIAQPSLLRSATARPSLAAWHIRVLDSREANEQVSPLALPNNRNDIIAAVRRKLKMDILPG